MLLKEEPDHGHRNISLGLNRFFVGEVLGSRGVEAV